MRGGRAKNIGGGGGEGRLLWSFIEARLGEEKKNILEASDEQTAEIRHI